MYPHGYYNKNFLPLLAIGHKYEKIASEKIEKRFNIRIAHFNNDYKYDFITDEGIKYEVKADFGSLKTGNFFIEYLEGTDKLTGISKTESHFYIITNSKEYYLIDTNKLKTLCNDAQTRSTLKTKTKGYIIKSSLLIANSELLE